MSILTARLSKNRFPLKSGSLLIAAALLSAGAQAADLKPTGMSNKPLDLNYSRVSNAATSNTFGANFCHLKSDELKIHIIPTPRMEIGTDAKITLTIVGDSYIKSYSVFKKGSPVSPSPTNANSPAPYYPAAEAGKGVYITSDFVKPWAIRYSEGVRGTWSYTTATPRQGTVYSDRFCLVKFPQVHTDYFEFGHELGKSVFFDRQLIPIFEDRAMANEFGLPLEVLPNGMTWTQAKALGISGTYLDKYSFDKLCKGQRTDLPGIAGEGQTTWNDEHYWPRSNWGVHTTLPGKIREFVLSHGAGYFSTDMFYLKKDRGNIPGFFDNDGDRSYVNYIKDGRGKQGIYNANKVTFDILPIPTPAENGDIANTKFITIESGKGYDLTVSNRNISEIVLTIRDKSGTQTLSWKSRNSANDMGYTSSGTKIFNAPGVDKTNDPYADFYQDSSSYFRGTLAAVNAKYNKYIEKMPLSLPPNNKAGDLNLVNMEELTFRLGGSPGDYTLSVEGQPLKFAPLYIGDNLKASAMELRNLCQ